jgi:hypothetical protein
MRPTTRELTGVLLAFGLAIGLGFASARAADPPPATRADLYVAPGGDDAWSGRLPRRDAAGTDGPFRTPARARDAVRALRRAEPARATPVVVHLRGGTYPLGETFRLGPEDSGTATSPTIYAAYPGETPVLSGGVPITDWKVDQPGVWVASLPGVKEGTWNFTQLFVGGARRPRPRVPAEGYAFIAGELEPTPAAQGRGADRFRYRGDDIRPDWYRPGDVEVLPFHIWTMSRLRLAEVRPDAKVVRFTGTTRGLTDYAKFKAGNRFLVENVREALDAPGEWYLDRGAGALTYRARPGETPGATEVVAPRLETIVELAGDLDGRRYVEHVAFENLDFAHTNWVTPPQGNSYSQAEVNLAAAVRAVGARDCRLEGCVVTLGGTYAIELGPGSKRNRVVGCTLVDLGGGGIKIGDTRREADDERVASHNTVADCLVAGIGRMHPAAVGVWIGHAHDNAVEHNDVHDAYYTGLSVGWSWGYGPSHAHHNRIEANHVHAIGQGVLSDMGGVYTLGLSPGSTIVGNLFHDIRSYDYGGWGIYFDEGTTGMVARGNVVYDTNKGGFHQHYGRDNLVEGNVFARSSGPQIVRTRAEEHLSFTFRRNVVYWDGGTLLGSNWDGPNVAIDENVYWRDGGGAFTFGGETLEQWRKRGRDTHSIVADPRFADASRDDFRLRPDSPALRLGITSTDVRGVGPRRALRGVPASPLARAFPPPPPPRPIADDFEDTPVGDRPAVARANEEGDRGTIRVTEAAAAGGRRALRFTDAPGLKQRYNPHLYYQADFGAGRIVGRFALRHQPGAMVDHEWRDGETPYHVGPNVHVAADGTVTAAGRTLGVLPEGRWARFTLAGRLGPEATGRFDVSYTVAGDAPVAARDLPCDPAFSALRWYGFTSNSDDRTTFDLDDLFVGPDAP